MSIYELMIDHKTLEMLEFERVVCSSEVNDFELLSLVNNLKQENTSHTWHNLPGLTENNALQAIKEFESKKRPTDLFFYHGIRTNGVKVLVGVGTVARKINNNFASEGFPVIARCFIRPNFRNSRLYFPMLKHRFEHCQKIFGSQLKCIHLGSQNPRIFSVIKKNIFDLPFVYIGDELLDIKGDSSFVRDYLYLTAVFQESVRNEIGQIANQSLSSRLSETFNALVSNRFESNSYGLMDSLLHSNESLINRKNCPHLFELVDLFEAIGVIRDRFRQNDQIDPQFVDRRIKIA